MSKGAHPRSWPLAGICTDRDTPAVQPDTVQRTARRRLYPGDAETGQRLEDLASACRTVRNELPASFSEKPSVNDGGAFFDFDDLRSSHPAA